MGELVDMEWGVAFSEMIWLFWAGHDDDDRGTIGRFSVYFINTCSITQVWYDLTDTHAQVFVLDSEHKAISRIPWSHEDLWRWKATSHYCP